MTRFKQIVEQEEGVVLSTSSGSLLCGWGRKKRTSLPVEGSWYFPDFFLEEVDPYIHFENLEEIDVPLVPKEQMQLKWKEPDFTHFDNAFSSLSHLKKIVPYVTFPCSGTFNHQSILSSAFSYLKQHPSCTLYGFWTKTGGMIGVTPETLFELNDQKLSTMAVAGTAPLDKKHIMETDPKLLEEHQIVIDGIVEDLSLFGQLKLHRSQVCSFGRLAHFVTPIDMKLTAQVGFEQIVQALHPTPALGAFPKEAGREWLRAYADLIPRGRFGAPFGFFGKKHSICHVAIRNIQWEQGLGAVLCGCGVTQASHPEAEKEEILLKCKAVKEALGLI